MRDNWPMSAHASHAFSIAHCTDSENLPPEMLHTSTKTKLCTLFHFDVTIAHSCLTLPHYPAEKRSRVSSWWSGTGLNTGRSCKSIVKLTSNHLSRLLFAESTTLHYYLSHTPRSIEIFLFIINFRSGQLRSSHSTALKISFRTVIWA